MQLSLSSASLYHIGLRWVFRLAAEAGFDGVELVLGPETWLWGPERVSRFSREYGLPVVTVHQTLIPVRAASQSRMIDAAEVAVRLESQNVVLHPPAARTWDSAEAMTWLAALEFCLKRTEGTSTRLTLENPGRHCADEPRAVLGGLGDLGAFAAAHGMGVTLDTCHLGLEGLDLLGAYGVLHEQVANVHLSNLSQNRPRIRWSLARALLTEHRMPDDGCLPLDRFLSLVSTDGYDGSIACEVSPVWLRGWSRQGVRESLARFVRFVRQYE